MLGIQRNRRNLCIYSLIFAVIQLHCIRCVYIRQLIAVYHRVEHIYIIYSGFVRQSYIINRQIDRKLSLAVICKLTVRLHLGKAVFLVVLILFADGTATDT